MLVDFGSLATGARVSPLSDVTLDVRPCESGSTKSLGGFHAWV